MVFLFLFVYWPVLAFATQNGWDSVVLEVQSAIDKISNVTGFSLSVGYVDAKGREFGIGSGPRSPNGLPPVAGTVSGSDTMLLGSGTKPFTAASVMRLVDQGKVSVDDKASLHIDPSLKRLNNTNMVDLFGPLAAKVTVGNILKMQSGINDFDIPDFDHYTLENGNHFESPLDALYVIAGMSGPLGCTNYNCTFVCVPGNCTSYSSTNFVLAGLILLTHAPENQNTFRTFDQAAALGLDTKNVYKHLHFPASGPLNENGLTVAGSSLQYGNDELFKQDASVLGWTCGNAVANGLDTARFYFELLGPNEKIVSKKSLDWMREVSLITVGWAKDSLEYGGGLMCMDPGDLVYGHHHHSPEPHNHTSSYLGHGGDTYGFLSDNGFYPELNASISVIINQDHDPIYPTYVATCAVVQVLARNLVNASADFSCIAPNPKPKYRCTKLYNQSICLTVDWGMGTSKAVCESICK